MKKNNKKGFTLIEIIITLGLILLITGVAIGSFVGISKQKKKEEWALVKGQIETAAEQYFSSNKYLFESLGTDSGKVYGVISVGELVNINYLNKVVDPRSGNPINKCAVVEVKFKNGVYSGKFDDTTSKSGASKCDNENGYIIVKTTGSPDVILNPTRLSSFPNGFEINDKNNCGPQSNNSGWCKDYHVGLINVNKKKGAVTVKACSSDQNSLCEPINEVVKNDNYYFYKDSDEGSSRVTRFKVTNQVGTTVVSINHKIDKTPPVLDRITMKKKTTGSSSDIVSNEDYTNDTWYNKNVYTEPSGSDTLSGVEGYYITTDGSTTRTKDHKVSSWTVYAPGTSYVSYKVCDKAGNCSSYSSNKTIKLDQTPPSLTVNLYKKSSSTNISYPSGLSTLPNNTEYNGYAFTTGSASDDLSGVRSLTYTTSGAIGDENNKQGGYRNINDEGKSTIYYRACDNAGNCNNSPTYTIILKRKGTCTQFASMTINDVSRFIDVDVSGNTLNSTSTSCKETNKNKTRFVFSKKDDAPDDLYFDEGSASGVWTSNNSPVTTTDWHSSWNNTNNASDTRVTKDTWCCTDYNCYSGSYNKFYTTSCVYAKCNNVRKKVCYYSESTKNGGPIGKGFISITNVD